jgi:hypothetical protein
MPYFISDQAQGCDGWATIKDDGEVIGCHTTKQAAIDQMVAVSIAEGLEPGGERAPAPLSDQIKGSDENEPGSAAGKGGDITLNEATETALANKARDHNDAMAERDRPEWTRVRLGALRSVYRRGAGAYSTSHRPGVTRGAWAMARVNAFLFLARTGRPENSAYIGDNDLLVWSCGVRVSAVTVSRIRRSARRATWPRAACLTARLFELMRGRLVMPSTLRRRATVTPTTPDGRGLERSRITCGESTP